MEKNMKIDIKTSEKNCCDDIYIEETEQSIKTLKRFREAWLRSSSSWNTELFQYADPDFYFYRFAIDRQEKSTEPLLTNIFYRVMERYGINFEVPSDRRDAPFVFIIDSDEGRTGYRFEDFYYDENVNDIVETYHLKEAVIIRSWRAGRADEWIARDNRQYQQEQQKLKAVSIETFFNKYFGKEEYCAFASCIEKYLQEAREVMGYKSIKYLSSMNLATQKLFEEKVLSDWDYLNYSFQIIDKTNNQIQRYLYLENFSFPVSQLQKMKINYVTKGLSKSMIGKNEYAESFITSEWLYHSLKGKRNFDYTSIISGYLKSIEQLLCQIVMINVDNNCRISMSGANDVITAAISNNVVAYKKTAGGWSVVPVNARRPKFKYIDFTSGQIQYMDSSIGTFEYFLRNNPQILVDSVYAETIADMVSCFRTECRNKFFHTHNLNDWEVVEKTRSNAIFLYYLLLGSCIIPDDKLNELGIASEDDFDILCKKVREFEHYNLKFIFEYSNGRKLNLVYDFIDNTIEYSNDGVEHYESLVFYDVGEFTDDTYEKLDAGIGKTKKVYLTRENLPISILGVHRNGRLEKLL